MTYFMNVLITEAILILGVSTDPEVCTFRF